MKFNKDTCDQIVDLVRAGAKPTAAAEQVGVSHRTYYLWRSRAKSEPEYEYFMSRIKQASAEHQNSLVNGMSVLAADCDYRALSYLLTHRYGWGQDTEQLVERILSVAEETLDPANYERFEQAIIDGALDMDS